MSEKYLRCEYFTTSNGIDRISKSLTCFDRSKYFIIKNKYKLSNYSSILIDDIYLCLEENKDGTINKVYMKSIEFEDNKRIIELQKHNSHSPQNVINDILSNEEMVMVEPTMPYLPFSTFYVPNYNGDHWVGGHPITLIHYDKKFYYYVEDDGLISKDINPIDKYNVDIGKVESSVFEKSLSEVTKIHTVSINRKNYEFLYEWVNMIILSILDNYNKQLEFNGITRYYGRKSIERLIQLCCSETLNLQDVFVSTEKLINPLSNIIKYRNIIAYSFQEMYSNLVANELINKLFSSIEASQNSLKNFLNVLLKNWYKQRYTFDRFYEKDLYYVLKCDDEFTNDLRNFLHFTEKYINKRCYCSDTDDHFES